MDRMSQQRNVYFNSESINVRGVNVARPNICTAVPASGNATNADSHYLVDAYDNGMAYGMTQHTGIQHQPDVHMGVPPSGNLYYSGMNPSTSASVSRYHSQLSGSSTFAVNEAYKWKNAEGVRGNYQHFNGSSSSLVAPSNARHAENGIPSLPHCSSWSRSGESMMGHNRNHMIQGNYLGQHFQPVWPDQQLNSNSNDGHAMAWHQSLPVPYVQASSANGSSSANARMGLQRYHDAAATRSGLRFPHHPPAGAQYHSFHHQTQSAQEIRGHSINFHPSVTAPSYRVQANPLRSSSILVHNAMEMGARHVGPAPVAGARMYQPHRSNMPETTLRHRNLPPMAFIQVDDVALLDDHHRDMRLDIEDMSYEELLALGERIGNVNTGLSEEMITSQMKTKSYLEEAPSEEQETGSCIICQDEYKNQEKIGILRCGHEYHEDCLRKWLLVKNVCPICKSGALTQGENCK